MRTGVIMFDAQGRVESAPVLFFEGLCEVNAIARENGRGVAPFGERDPPADVFRAAPLQRKRLFR